MVIVRSGWVLASCGLALSGACSFAPGALPGASDGGAIDAGDAGGAPDVNMTTVDARTCFGTGIGMLCLSAAPTAPLTLAQDLAFDTGETACTEVVTLGGTEMCVLAGTTVSLASGLTFRGVGSRPLILVASDTMAISGALSVSSLAGLPSGAGAGSAPCPSVAAGASSGNGAGGGAGGSFGGRGGNGGTGDDPGALIAGATSAAAFTTVNAIRGGCPGTNGGTGDDPGGAGRAGGGALYLIAATSITIEVSGGVYAAGRGGGGALSRGGGGGGGSGGFIGLDAPAIVLDGFLAANGGGGGEGARVQTLRAFDGADGTAFLRAPGGTDGDPNGGAGGAGSEGPVTVGDPGVAAPGGGGGGGGGAGFVYLKGTVTGTGLVSPAALMVP